MRHTIKPHRQLGDIDIANIQLDYKSRDDTPAILIGLQHLYFDQVLVTTTYTVDEICNLYHQHWSMEELYKISKHTIAVDEFRGQTERSVRQELYAHFNLIAMARMLT